MLHVTFGRLPRRSLPLTVGLLWLLGAGPAAGQSFEELEARLASHPALQTLAYRGEQMMARSEVTAALPDPELALGVNNLPLQDPSFSRFLPTNRSIGLRQAIPNRQQRHADAAALRESAAQLTAEQQALRARLRSQLIIQLHERARVAQQRTLRLDMLAQYDALEQAIDGEIRSGKPLVYRLAEIAAERARSEQALAALDRERAQIDAALIELVGEVPDTPPPPVRPAHWSGDVEDLLTVRAAAGGIRSAASRVTSAEADWGPDWGLQLSYQQREAGVNFAGDDWVSGQLTFTVPLWSHRRQEPALRAAEAAHSEARMAYQLAARRAAASIANERANIRGAEASLEALSQSLDAVSAQLNAEQAIYRSGQGSLAKLIDGEITRLQLRSEVAAIEAERAAAIARLNAWVAAS